MNAIRYIFFGLIASFIIGACGKDIMADNMLEIEDYLIDNNLNAQSTSSGLYYIINNPGVGDNPTIENTVTVHYHGYLTNGSVFDSSIDRGTPLEIPLTNVIRGWREGIPLFKKGGSGHLIIPSHLAYGENPPTGIPSNAVLVFDIELINFN